VQITTDDVPERDRPDLWEATLHRDLGMQAGPLPDASKPFQADLTGRFSGPLFNLRVAADAHRVMRLPRDIARRHWDSYWIYCEASAGAWFKAGNREFVTRTGDLFIFDSDEPFETLPTDRFTHEALLVSKVLLHPHLPALGGPWLTRLSGRSGVNALAASYIDALTRNWDGLSEPVMHLAADTLARLIGIACGAVAVEQSDAVRAGRLVEAKQYIDRHLADPELSPAAVAASLRIAVRTMHALFEPTGTSFARYVARRRLEECRIALLGNPTRAVTDIAFAWGFGTLSNFYRAFQATFGMSPGDLRARSRDEHRS
jgi:AraC-like DNA-binding protein